MRTRTKIMGVLNVTPDSFSDGGSFAQIDDALRQAEAMLQQGADVIDIGGESTRPFASPVTPQVEQARVLPVIEALMRRGISNLSIDTRHASTALQCHELGVRWLNDVSALGYDPQMLHIAHLFDVVVLMHARGTPDSMQLGEIRYEDAVAEVVSFLQARVAQAMQHGVAREKILVDPGIGFGKRLQHNLAILRGLAALKDIAGGVLVGTSRKAFIGELTGLPAHERDCATIGAVSIAVANGADWVRVHNVKATREALQVVDPIVRATL